MKQKANKKKKETLEIKMKNKAAPALYFCDILKQSSPEQKNMDAYKLNNIILRLRR